MKSKSYIGLFGNSKLAKAYCIECKRYAIIIDDELQCCYASVSELPERYKRESQPPQRRKVLSEKARKAQLELQEHRCFYCNRKFGSTVYNRHNRLIKLIIHFDHLIPYELTQNNNVENFVAACQICNGIKTDYVFQTVSDC